MSILAHVPMLLRGAFLAMICVWSVFSLFKYEDRVLRRLIEASRGSVRRAFLIVALYHLTFVAVQCVFGVISAITYHASPDLLAVPMSVTMLLIGLTLCAPFVLPMCSKMNPVRVRTSVTSFAELRKLGASKPVARAIAYPGAVLWFTLLWPVWFGTMMAVIFIE